MKLPAIEKAVHKKRTPTAAAVKCESLDDDTIIIDDEEEVKPIVVCDAAEVKTFQSAMCGNETFRIQTSLEKTANSKEGSSI